MEGGSYGGHCCHFRNFLHSQVTLAFPLAWQPYECLQMSWLFFSKGHMTTSQHMYYLFPGPYELVPFAGVSAIFPEGHVTSYSHMCYLKNFGVVSLLPCGRFLSLSKPLRCDTTPRLISLKWWQGPIPRHLNYMRKAVGKSDTINNWAGGVWSGCWNMGCFLS